MIKFNSFSYFFLDNSNNPKKYINFYEKFILQTKTFSDGGVILNSDLEVENYAN